jgi:hypothetical protein
MITGIDHIVVLVNDLPDAMDDYGRLGFTVELGGEHPGGTHNALVAFADGTYLELIAFKEPDQPHTHPWYDALRHGEGLVAFALGSSDLAAEAEAIRARGLAVDGPDDGSRLRPDGVRLAWRNASAGTGPRGRQRPFLIEDVTPRALRVASGALARHANSVTGVIDVTLAVANVATAAADLAAILGVEPPTPREDGETRMVTLPTPRGAVVLKQPLGQAGPLAEALAARGDHLYATSLAMMPQGGEPVFQPELAHGANISLQIV